MADPFSLAGRTALITGGSRGIGFGVAQAFVAAGARVVITARGEGQLREAAAALGPLATAIRCDNADPADIARAMAEAWAVAPLDIVVNNAGISPYFKRAEQVTLEDWDSVVDINLRGTFFCSTEAARRMFEAGRPGSIINMSSLLGTMPQERLSVYGATKAGMDLLTKVLALEWADRGVRVNSIAPGWVGTDFTEGLFASRWGEKLRAEVPMGRFAEPGDIAGAALYLASDASRYVTGTTMVVDGGRALR